jgi:hypothetical protein
MFTIYQTQQNRVYCKLEGNQAFLDATFVSTLLQELGLAYSETLPSGPGPPYRSVVEPRELLEEPDGNSRALLFPIPQERRY